MSPRRAVASTGVRSLRAAVFAVLCVRLAAGGHALATGMAPPVWTQMAGSVPVFVVGFALGGRAPSFLGIGGATVAAQGGLHLAFDALRPHAATAATAAHAGMRMAPQHALTGHTLTGHALTPHASAAHVCAAVVLAWSLRRGEAAVWSLLRRAVACVCGLVAWWSLVRGGRGRPTAPGTIRPAVGEAWSPRPVRLRHAVHRRGPPMRMSYAV
ncbi:hypothetical protein [Streptomyces sp. NRRL B-3229]|uniref:hypothetical protein n=1 Tax=Streptomyces sp. NRRL B-3229 TaxID=1463836 RepID=UPI0004C25CC3|nr:hypothetical protein [Streptomyces sp. NRRL B-3229]